MVFFIILILLIIILLNLLYIEKYEASLQDLYIKDIMDQKRNINSQNYTTTSLPSTTMLDFNKYGIITQTKLNTNITFDGFLDNKVFISNDNNKNLIEFYNINRNIPNLLNGSLTIQNFDFEESEDDLEMITSLCKFIKYIDGDLIIKNNKIIDLELFLNLRKVSGKINIKNNTQLISLCGLKNIDISNNNDVNIRGNSVKFISANLFNIRQREHYLNIDDTFPSMSTCKILESYSILFKKELFKFSRIMEILNVEEDPKFNQKYILDPRNDDLLEHFKSKTLYYNMINSTIYFYNGEKNNTHRLKIEKIKTDDKLYFKISLLRNNIVKYEMDSRNGYWKDHLNQIKETIHLKYEDLEDIEDIEDNEVKLLNNIEKEFIVEQPTTTTTTTTFTPIIDIPIIPINPNPTLPLGTLNGDIVGVNL